MRQRDRDRLVVLKKAQKGLITQGQAAEELGQSERHVRRLLNRLKGKGDGGLVHALRGRRSNRKLDEKIKRDALEILNRDVYRGFGPTLAAEYLAVLLRAYFSRFREVRLKVHCGSRPPRFQAYV